MITDQPITRPPTRTDAEKLARMAAIAKRLAQRLSLRDNRPDYETEDDNAIEAYYNEARRGD